VDQSGSYSEDAEYESETHTVVLAINYLFNERLNLSLTGTYTQSDAEMDQLRNYSGLTEPASYDYDLSSVDEYSDLDIRQIDVSVGADYKVDDNFSVGFGFTYLEYDDDERGGYRHDDSGDAYIANVSVSYLF